MKIDIEVPDGGHCFFKGTGRKCFCLMGGYQNWQCGLTGADIVYGNKDPNAPCNQHKHPTYENTTFGGIANGVDYHLDDGGLKETAGNEK